MLSLYIGVHRSFMVEVITSEKNLWFCDPVVDVSPFSPGLQHV